MSWNLLIVRIAIVIVKKLVLVNAKIAMMIAEHCVAAALDIASQDPLAPISVHIHAALQ